MFENMTYENIMSEMMDDMPDGINTQEGSLIYNACAKQALKLEEVYIALEYIYENLTPETMDEEHLLSYAKERGIKIKQETNAVLQADFEQEIEIGTRFTRNDLDYMVIENIEGYSYKLKCDTAGTVGNTMFGELSPIDYIENWQGGKITKLLIPAENAESIEEIRKKILNSYDVKDFGGNRSQYIKFFHDFEGVGAVKIKRREKETGYITATILDANYNVPSHELIQRVQTAIDPEENHGEGEGFAPIAHSVIVYSAKEKKLNIRAKIQFQEETEKEGMKSYIESAIDEYLGEARKEWENSEKLTVRVFQIIACLAKLDGIMDINSVEINGSNENIELEWNEVPTRGEIDVI